MVLFTIILQNPRQNCEEGRAEIGEGLELENRTHKAFSQRGQNDQVLSEANRTTAKFWVTWAPGGSPGHLILDKKPQNYRNGDPLFGGFKP